MTFSPDPITAAADDRPLRFRTRIKGCFWSDWRKPGIDGWRVTAAEREFIKRDTLDGLCVEYASGQRVSHLLSPDDEVDANSASPGLGGDEGEAGVHKK